MCSFFPRASKKPPSPLHDIDFLLSPYQVKGDASDCQGWAHTCTCSMHGVGTNTQMYIWYTCDTKGKKEASTYKKMTVTPIFKGSGFPRWETRT